MDSRERRIFLWCLDQEIDGWQVARGPILQTYTRAGERGPTPECECWARGLAGYWHHMFECPYRAVTEPVAA